MDKKIEQKPASGIFRLLTISGTEEIGMNMAIYSYEKKTGEKYNILVDCGTSFVDMPGAVVTMPDLPSIIEKGTRIDAVVLTHGHEDHIGALAYLQDYIKAPIYATPFTCGLIDNKFLYIKKKDYKLEKVKLGETRQIGPFSIQWIAVTHSIPDSAMLAIEAGGIRVVHTGDYKLDPDPIVGSVTDHESLIAFGKKGVHALIGDSTNIHEETSAHSEGEVAASLQELIAKTKTGKFILTCFASNIARVRSCVEAAKLAGRKTLLLGTSLKKSTEIAQQLGYLTDEHFVEDEEACDVHPDKLMVICTGSQGEENSALWKMTLKMRAIGCVLEKGDTVVFSARVIDGRQVSVRRIINQLVERGIRVLHPWNSQDSCIHASGHPGRPDILQVWEWVNPLYVIPVHSEAEHRISHIAFAKSKGYKTFNMRNGMIIEIRENEIVKVDLVKHEKLVYDGNRLLPEQSEVFKMRREANENGIIAITIYPRHKQQMCLVTNYGVFDADVDKNDDGPLTRKIKTEIEKMIKRFSSPDMLEKKTSIKGEIIRAARNAVYNIIKKNPLIICHIIS